MLENVLKPKETDTVMLENTFLEDWDEIGTKMAKKGHLLPKSGINSQLVSIQRVKKARKSAGWIYTQTRYCQMVRDAHKIKRLEFCRKIIQTNDAEKYTSGTNG